MNISKIKAVAVNKERVQGSTGDGEEVKKVDICQYLCSIIASDAGVKLVISTEIKKFGCFAGLRKQWRLNQISLRTKLRIFNSNVNSVLLYESVVWCISS